MGRDKGDVAEGREKGQRIEVFYSLILILGFNGFFFFFFWLGHDFGPNMAGLNGPLKKIHLLNWLCPGRVSWPADRVRVWKNPTRTRPIAIPNFKNKSRQFSEHTLTHVELVMAKSHCTCTCIKSSKEHCMLCVKNITRLHKCLQCYDDLRYEKITLTHTQS